MWIFSQHLNVFKWYPLLETNKSPTTTLSFGLEIAYHEFTNCEFVVKRLIIMWGVFILNMIPSLFNEIGEIYSLFHVRFTIISVYYLFFMPLKYISNNTEVFLCTAFNLLNEMKIYNIWYCIFDTYSPSIFWIYINVGHLRYIINITSTYFVLIFILIY